MDMKKLLLLLGGVLLGAGLILGLVPMKAGGTNCGSALFTSNDARVADLTDAMIGLRSRDRADACEDALSGRRAVALAVGIPGAVLLLLGAGTSSKARPGNRPAAAAGASLDPGRDARMVTNMEDTGKLRELLDATKVYVELRERVDGLHDQGRTGEVDSATLDELDTARSRFHQAHAAVREPSPAKKPPKRAD